MKNMKMYLLELLRAAVNETVPENPPVGLDWKVLYALADYHSVAGTAYYGILRLPEEGRPQSDILIQFQKASQLVLGRETMQHFEVQRLLDDFEEAGIVSVPLKGWLLKRYYPRPDMRSMSDVDILIRPEDMDKILDIMKKYGFELERRGENHDGYRKHPHLYVEIHQALFPSNSPYQPYFKSIMENVHPAEGKKYESRMTWEYFYFHLIAHLAKHFNHGGTGLRSFMDIYIFREKFRGRMDEALRKKLLEESGLDKFAGVVEEMSYAMFAEGLEEEERNRYETLNEFVFRTGTYGTKETEVAESLMECSKHRGKYLFFRFFPGLKMMRLQYPILEKAPVLLPLFWIVRGFRSVFLRRSRLALELRTVKEADESTLREIEEIQRLCGLKPEKEGN